MAYTVNQLISGAFYASGIVAREFETVSGSQVSDGLLWLNNIIGEKRVDEGMIPYETTFGLNSIVGQEKYFIPHLIQVNTIVFYLDSVRYQMNYTKRNQYFGGPRVENIQTLPYTWYFERQVGGGNLYIYFEPNQNYPLEIHGIFDIAPVTLEQDLSANITTANLGIPTFYGSGALSPGQFVISTPSTAINGASTSVDLMGVYPNIGALINYINSGIIPGVKASILVNDFIVSSTTEPPVSISVQTTGYPGGTNFIGSVTAATTADLDALYSAGTSGVGATLGSFSPAALVIDGVGISTIGRRVLVKNQTLPVQNGSYVLTQVGSVSTAWILTRTTNYDQSFEIHVGDLFTVLAGTENEGLTFIQTAQVNNVNTSPITFSIFNALTFSNFSTIENPDYEIFNALGFDDFYITYLRYALADRICAEYNYDTPPNVLKELAKYQAWISNQSRLIDLQTQKVSTLQRRLGLNYAQINIGRGFTVS